MDPKIVPYPSNMPRLKPITKLDEAYILVTWILGFLTVELFSIGFGMTILIFSIYAAFFIYFKLKKLEFSKTGLLLAIPNLLLAMSYSIFSNLELTIVNVPVMLIIGIAQMYILLDIGKFKWTQSFFVFDIAAAALTPFKNLDIMPRSIKKLIMHIIGKKSRLKKFLSVLLGIAISIPLLFIVYSLLAQADLVFRGLFNGILERIKFQPSEYLFKTIFGFILAFFVFSVLYSLGNRDSILGERVTVENQHKFDSATITTVLISLCLIYLVFAGVQIYNLFLFSESTASSMVYAKYAREGFFQLVAASGINLSIIWLSLRFGGNPPAPIHRRILEYLLIFLTLILLVSSLTRLILYINGFGMTQLRIYSLWAIAVIFIFLALTTYSIWKPAFKLFPALFIVSIIAYVGLNYMNPDYLIAKYNVDAYLSGKMKTMDVSYLSGLSDDIYPALTKLSDKKNTKNIKTETLIQLDDEFRRILTNAKTSRWQDLDFMHLYLKTKG